MVSPAASHENSISHETPTPCCPVAGAVHCAKDSMKNGNQKKGAKDEDGE
jgi:hypothetical protein